MHFRRFVLKTGLHYQAGSFSILQEFEGTAGKGPGPLKPVAVAKGDSFFVTGCVA
jgi:hypothetical protein